MFLQAEFEKQKRLEEERTRQAAEDKIQRERLVQNLLGFPQVSCNIQLFELTVH